MTGRYVNEKALLRRIPKGLIRANVAAWLTNQPRAPLLVSATECARMLDIKPPHISRLRAQGRMPEPVPVRGGNDAYIYEEIEALAEELAREREERARRKEERDGRNG